MPQILHQDEIRKMQGGEALIEILTEIRDNQTVYADRLTDMEGRLTAHITDAFPGGDAAGHRRYHLTQIEILEERRRLRVAIQEKTIGGLVFGALGILAMAMWDYMIKHLK